jgi:hypothetical protein
MAEKSLVNEVALIDTVGAAALELLLGVLLVLDVPLLPHAATRRATPVAAVVSVAFLLRIFNENHLRS